MDFLPNLNFNYYVPLSLFVSYAILCRALRYQRIRSNEKKYGYRTRNSFAKMTTQEAHEIQCSMVQLEFPFTVTKSLEFALFKTYGIPTISHLLIKTKQLTEMKYVPKRYADTFVLIAEWVNNPPRSERRIAAISRTNYLHSLYQKQGLISNDDMLYTLSMFALEPIRWVERFEWREMTMLERCAMGVFWMDHGDAMNISYKDLPSYPKWRDGLHWLEELETWSVAYEERCMVPHIDNHKTGVQTTELLLYYIPESLKNLGRQAVSALMEDRLRTSMMFDVPPKSVSNTVYGLLYLRQFLLRHLALPRPVFMKNLQVSEEQTKDGRAHLQEYENEPFYVANTFVNRWGPKAWTRWMTGRPIPGDAPEKFMPQGYKIDDVGPRAMEGKGVNELRESKARLREAARGGCPMGIGKF